MRLRARLLRLVRASAIALLSLILLAFVFVQYQQYLLRHRAARLLADFQSLRLKHSTWSDAQQLITRWGAFGHYDGTCTSESCSYSVTLWDVESTVDDQLRQFMQHRWPERYSGLSLSRIFHALGGHHAAIVIGFLVEDGIVERSGVGVQLEVQPDKFWCEMNCGYGLMLAARASQTLNSEEPRQYRILGDYAQLARHPNYKVGRPDGCEICMSGEVTFTPFSSPAEIRALTSYNLDCLTRHFHPCRTLPDLLPIARDWRLYSEEPSVPQLPESTKPCDIPVYASGRDASSVLVVNVLSVQTATTPPDETYPDGRKIETANVQVVRTLKGQPTWHFNSKIKAESFDWDVGSPLRGSERFEIGKSYIVIPDPGSSDKDLLVMRCGVLPDSPEVRAELQKGFAQNDQLRHEEKFGNILW